MAKFDQSCTHIEFALSEVNSRGPLFSAAIFARAAAHGLKNRLNPLTLQLELLRRRCSDDTTAQLVATIQGSLRELDAMLEMAQRFGQQIAPPQEDDAALTHALERVEEGLRGVD